MSESEGQLLEAMKDGYTRRKVREEACVLACDHITTDKLLGHEFILDPTRSSATFNVYILKERES